MPWVLNERFVAGYLIYTMDFLIADSVTPVEVEVFSPDLLGDPSNSKVLYSLEMTEAAGAGVLSVEAQLTNTNFAGTGSPSLVVVGSVTRSMNVLEIVHGTIDLTGIKCGRVRLRFFTDGVDTLNDGTVRVRYQVVENANRVFM